MAKNEGTYPSTNETLYSYLSFRGKGKDERDPPDRSWIGQLG